MTNKKGVSNMVKTKQLNTKDLSGLVYVVYNPAFYNLIKVGETSFNEFEKRGLNNTSVPEDFEVLALFDCVDRKAVEAAAHKAFNDYRHRASSGRLTEFFFADKVKDIIAFISNLPGVKKRNPRQGMRKVNCSFTALNIPVGSKIYFNNQKDPEHTAIVHSDKKIQYKGKIVTVSQAAIAEVGNSVNGWLAFYYNNKPLKERQK